MTAGDSDDDFSVFEGGETVEVPGQQSRESPVSGVPGPRYQHEEWLHLQYNVLGKTLQEIADDCGVTEKTIWRWTKQLDIDTRPGGPRPGPWKDEDWLRSQYVDQQKSVLQIADEQGCDEKTIRNWLAEHGIETRDYSERHPASREQRRYQDPEWLREQYVQRGRGAPAIADACGVSDTTIYRWLDNHGIETRSVDEARQLNEARSVRLPQNETDGEESARTIEREAGGTRYEGPETGIVASYQSDLGEETADVVESPYRDADWLREQYEQTGTASEIADLCDVEDGTIYYWMDKHGIDREQGNEGARYRDEQWLRTAYDDLGTIKAVADACGVSAGTIRNWMVRFDIDRRPDAVARDDVGGQPEKTLADLVEALIALYELRGEWLGPSEYEKERHRVESAPSTSWFYSKNPAGLNDWSDAVNIAKRRHAEREGMQCAGE